MNYQKYLLTEKKSMAKKIASLKKKLIDAMTTPELRVASSQVAQIIRTLDDDKVIKELVSLLSKAKERVKE